MAYYGQNFECTGLAQDNHIMAMGNLNKSMETKPTTTKASKVVQYPRGSLPTRIKIAGLHFINFSKTFSYKVNLAAQS